MTTKEAQMWEESQQTEDKGGVFDRQIRIQQWKQSEVEKQVCLLLGTGGLGTGVAMSLARLGVKKLILVDKDVVDTSNLNRQILFSKDQVGKLKTQAAKETILQCHKISDLEIETHNFDVLLDWQRVVRLSNQATVVFNMIDVGSYFDAAVQSLCMSQSLLLIQGGNFCQQFSVDIFRIKYPCLLCSQNLKDTDVIDKILPSKIKHLENLTFLPRDRNPISQSNVYLCLMTCQMMVCRFCTLLINDENVNVSDQFIMTVNSGDVYQYDVEGELDCRFCTDMKTYKTSNEYLRHEDEEEKKPEIPQDRYFYAKAGLFVLTAGYLIFNQIKK